MKKIISILLSIFIVTTVVSSLVFASETGLISDYNPTPSWWGGGSVKTVDTTSEPGVIIVKASDAITSTTNTFYLSGPQFDPTSTTPVPSNAKYIKLSFSITSKVELEKMFGTINSPSALKDAGKRYFYPTDDHTTGKVGTWKAGQPYNITILLDIDSQSVCLYCDGMFMGGQFNVGDLTTLQKYRFSPIPKADPNFVIGVEVYRVTNLKQEAYDSTATLESMGLYMFSAEYDPDEKEYTVDHTMSSMYDKATGATEIAAFNTWIAGYDENNVLLFAKVISWSPTVLSSGMTVSAPQEAHTLRAFCWSGTSMEPLMPVSPVKTSN